MTIFNVEMRYGQDIRLVEADSVDINDETGWLIFYRNPPQGGQREYWRVRCDAVVSMETKP
jgi:hypothetical protein